MPPKKGKESVERKSAAEFFTENQTIAGFDNPGKSLFTTIRELVENSLDAAESIGEPPDIRLEIRELSQAELDSERGVLQLARVDETLFEGSTKEKEKARLFYRVTCTDNGCGVSREAIPDAFGRVLAGSKYGARQARGKFGLGAKMALIWGKKSSGLPLTIRTATAPSSPTYRVVLDIDIQKNEPRVLEDTVEANEAKWRGAELTVTVGGQWSQYRARIVQYLRQLAIITPYASLALDFRGSGNSKRDVRLEFLRRTTKVPPVPRATGYHPAALDELLLEQLLRKTASSTLGAFCRASLQGAAPSLMKRVLREGGFDESMTPLGIADDAKKIRRLARLFRDVNCFSPPSADGLAPVGEYNLRLGVEKEINPTYVATACSNVSAHEGHAFIVEAAVSVGGSREEEEGLRVYRFANRIPLLFEGGADVATIVAKKRVRWGNYKIDVKKERVGVFVSLVSTKIPFKGTSKEYVGEDAAEIHDAIRDCLMVCGQQLKAQLAKRDLHKRDRDRRKNLLRYVPDVANALSGVLGTDADALKKALTRHVDECIDLDAGADDGGAPKLRVDMRRRAVVRDVVSTRFALRLFAPRGANSLSEEDAAAPERKRPRMAAWAGVFDDDDDEAVVVPAASVPEPAPLKALRRIIADEDENRADPTPAKAAAAASSEEDSDDAPPPPKRAARASRARKKASYAEEEEEEEDDDDVIDLDGDDDASGKTSPPLKKRAVSAPAPAAARRRTVARSVSDEEAPAVKPAAAPAPPPARSDFEFDDDDDDDDDFLEIDGLSPAKGAPLSARARPPPARSRLGRGDGLAVADSSSDGDSDSSEDVQLAALAPPPKKWPRPLPAAADSGSSDGGGDD